MNLQEKPGDPLTKLNLALRMKQVVFIDIRDSRLHEMRRQYEFRLNQRKCQAKYDNESHGFEEWSDDAANKHHWRKRCDGCQDAECCRNCHAVCALDDIVQRVSVRTYLGVGALANDDCIVDDNTKHNNEAEQADGIDRDRPGRHQPQRTEECDRQADHHPECNLHAQEERQHDKYEQSTGNDVLLHLIEAILEVLRQIDPGLYKDAVGKRLALLRDVLLNDSSRLDFTLAAA